MAYTRDTELHAIGEAKYTAQTQEVEFHCKTCKALVRGQARHGLDGLEAINDMLTQHSVLADMPVQLGVTGRTYSVPASRG